MDQITIDAAPRFWCGPVPEHCDFCEKPIATSFVDGLVNGGTTWANMCLYCSRMYGAGVAPGKGQLYQAQPDGRWLKTQG